MEALQKFMLVAAKIGVGITIAALLVTGAVLLYLKSSTDVEERANAPLTEWKDWPVVKTDALGGATFELATMWSDSRLFYRLQVDGDPAAIASAVDSRTDLTFILTFNNSQGFWIFEKRIPLREMSGTVGGDGVRTGLSWADDEYQSADTYRDVAAWNLQWMLRTVYPPRIVYPPLPFVVPLPVSPPGPAAPS